MTCRRKINRPIPIPETNYIHEAWQEDKGSRRWGKVALTLAGIAGVLVLLWATYDISGLYDF